MTVDMTLALESPKIRQLDLERGPGGITLC